MTNKLKGDKGFCILPFIHLSTRTDGSMQICCHANSSRTPENLKPGCNRTDNNEIVNLKINQQECLKTQPFQGLHEVYLEALELDLEA